MEKKKLNLATIESALKNEAITVKGKDEKELISLIIVDKVNHEEKSSEHHSFLYGDANVIAAAIAMRMLKSEVFSDMIYKAVYAYENNAKVKMEKAFKGIDEALGRIIDNLDAIVGEKKPNKKRIRKQ